MRSHVIEDGTELVSRIDVGRAMDATVLNAASESGAQQVGVLCQPATRHLAERYVTALDAAGFRSSGFALPDGEDAKRMLVVEDVYKHLNEQSFTRNDLVIGVGGGALTDVAGFVAGTYLRGVPAVYVPTTVLGAVDAAIGGKTGVNVDGKNLAGVFKHPQRVVVDVDTLDALPDAQKREGASEAIKTGFIADMEIVSQYQAHGIDCDLEDVVNRSIAVKARIVSRDFKEHGERAFLNYGHTVGHAIETATGRSHGESVAIGMVAAGAASEVRFQFEGSEAQLSVLARVGLPTRADDAKAPAIRSLMAMDKKRDATGLRMVLLRQFELPEVVTADDATVQAALDAVGIA